jgi:type IV pilus assembly protein PilW
MAERMPCLVHTHTRERQLLERGFGLVEVMVALVVGLIAVAAIMTVFWSSEGQKRTITGGADASENALIALATIERDLRVAGLGLVGLNCAVINGYNQQVGANFSFSPLPVAITGNTPAAGSDTLTLAYSTSPFGNLPTQLSAPMATPVDAISVMNGDGIVQGDAILLSEGTKPCTILQASADSARATALSWAISHNPGPNFPFNNPPAAIFPPTGYVTGTMVVNMGAIARRQYFVQGAQLMMQDLNLPLSNVAPLNPVPVADGVISVRALYGRDTNADGFVDVYDNTAPANAGDLVAIQLAAVARSGQLERTAVSPATLQLWDGGTLANGGALALDATAQRYRYKVYQTTIPLRNVIWGNN